MDDYGGEVMRNLTNQDVEAVAERLVERLAGTRFVSPEEHYEHHRWVSGQIKAEEIAEEDSRALRMEFKKRAIGAVGLAGLIYLVANLGEAMIAAGQWLMKLAQ